MYQIMLTTKTYRVLIRVITPHSTVQAAEDYVGRILYIPVLHPYYLYTNYRKIVSNYFPHVLG